MLKLSIIVPVYNVEKYIRKCLDSLLNQDLDKSEYEILVINDGTKDSSAIIAKEIAAKNSNMRVIDKENGGLSSARNEGLEHAQGEYVFFVDSDDYIESNVLKTILNKCYSDNLDMLAFNFRLVDDTGRVSKEFYTTKIPTNKAFKGSDYLVNDRFIVMVYTYLYRLEFLRQNDIKFIQYGHEDENFTPRALYFCKKIIFIDLHVYNYYQRIDSYINNYKPKHVYDSLSILKSLNNFINSGVIKEPEVEYYMKKRVNYLFYITIKRSIRSRLNMEYVMLEEARRDNILHNGIYPKIKRKYKLMIVSPKLFVSYLKFRDFLFKK